MTYATLRYEVRDHVALITLNRPDVLNALNLEMARDLMHVSIRCDEDAEVRAVVLAGEGRVFCGGGDLKSFAALGPDVASHVKEVTTYLHAGISRLSRMDAPLIAAVQGSAAGAGLALALACDLVLAGESARFVMAYTRVGLSPDGSASFFLPRAVGMRRALELTLTNRVLSAQEALDWGIITRVVPDSELSAQTQALAAQLAAGPPRAFAGAKRLLRESWTNTLETQMEHETRSVADMARTQDAQEGIAAFLEKRAPKFTGR